MHIYKTKLQQTNTIPTQLEILQILQHRKYTTSQQNYLYQRLQAGRNGENAVIEFINRYGKNHWLGIQNLWLNYNNNFEIDLLLMSRNTCYLFEIKNYNGKFVYQDGSCYLNDVLLSNNCVSQAVKTYTNFKNLMKDLSPKIKVKGAIIFIGEHNEVNIKSNISHIEVIRRYELKNYLENISKNESQFSQNISPKSIIRFIENKETTNPYSPTPLDPEELTYLHKGIYCEKCKSFDINIYKYYITCACGWSEEREKATLRTIEEYCALNYDKNIKRSNIEEFINYQASDKYVLNILKKNFTMINKNKFTYYKK